MNSVVRDISVERQVSAGDFRGAMRQLTGGVERHSHAIVIGCVLDLQLSTRTAALAYWQGQYVAIDRDEDAVRLAEVSVPNR